MYIQLHITFSDRYKCSSLNRAKIEVVRSSWVSLYKAAKKQIKRSGMIERKQERIRWNLLKPRDMRCCEELWRSLAKVFDLRQSRLKNLCFHLQDSSTSRSVVSSILSIFTLPIESDAQQEQKQADPHRWGRKRRCALLLPLGPSASLQRWGRSWWK